MICFIDCSKITHAEQMHRKLANLLAFPQWYGNNLDALFDCLTELSTPTQLHFSNWDATAQWASGFEAVLTDAQQSCPSLTVVFE